ncbi:MAG: hypothetical protein AAFR39_09930 [Pseudomonadota bacterium]
MIRSTVIATLTFAAGFAISPLVLPHMQTVLSEHQRQPYAGQEQRQISSLSRDDISALENGEGWGLAKPAELNGFPGPLHILELSEQLELEDRQKLAVETAFNTMKAKARELGNALIEAEASLDAAFEQQIATPGLLAERLALTEELRAALRAVHLSAHLQVTPLLNDDQKRRYAELRGYGAGGHGGHGGH